MNNQSNLLRIKAFATMCHCSIYTLRYYDEIGLLKPRQVCEKSGYRYYTSDQLILFTEIKEFQEIGFSVQEIMEFKQCNNNEILTLIQNKIHDLQCLIDKSLKIIEKYEKKEKETV